MTMATESAVAIVGMACRFPGAGNAGEFWATLRDGKEGIRGFSPGELEAAGVDPELFRRPDYVPAKGLMPDAHRFDWSFFGYSRAEAATIDPQQRVFLECASAAIDDAGIDPRRFPGWIGVYAGADTVALPADENLDPLMRVIGREKDFLATRVAYKLGLRGPAITVQTACSTALTAVHTAVQSLLCYESDAALAGGVAVAPPRQRGYLYKDGGILSRDGHCRPFDAAAGGTVPSEGVGIVVLKRMADAVRDNDRIVAVVLGSAVNNDGGEKIGYTAPSVPGQREVIGLAQRLADVDPADVDYIEAHGTGTRIGDPVELQALTEAFRASTDATGHCRVGSVKSNIGHTGAAAGAAGLIKTALMLQHGEFVPTVHFRSPNPLLEIERTPFRICAENGHWPVRGVRLAGVSSFGVGGTNAHVVLQGAPPRARRTARGGPRVLAVSAASATALERTRAELADHLESETGLALADVSWTLATGRRRFARRQAVVADDLAQAAALLRNAGAPANAGSTEPAVAFLFPGQGTLRHGAGASARRLLAGFRQHFDEIAGEVLRCHALDLSPVVADDADPAWFTDTVHQQLGLLALGYALGRQLGEWGIEPAAMLGNSIGEYAAAVLADVWTMPDAVRLVHARARAMRDTAPGRMVTVNASADRLTSLLARHPAASVAVQGPGVVVLSGSVAAMGRLLADPALDELDVRTLETERAFHSALMDPAAATLRAAVAATPHQRARHRMVSNLTGTWAAPDRLGDPGYWAEHLRRPVRLDDGMASLLDHGCNVFVELGPGTSMIGGLRRHSGRHAGDVGVSLLPRPGEPGDATLLRALGGLWARGLDIPIETLGEADPPYRCSLPAHPFDSRLLERPAAPAEVSTGGALPGAVPTHAAGADVRGALARHWCEVLGVPAVADGDDFFALGGESLLAVHFMSLIKERTGLHVPVAEFSRTPSFGRLVELAEQARGADVSAPGQGMPGLVVLRAGGTRTPLFLVADALGTTVGYQALADRLDDDRPVYGVEPAESMTRVRIEDLAARHVGVVRRIRPHGPYLLGGWSFGAVVAHEMARLLLEQGSDVESLLCLDGYVPDTGGRPIASDLAFLMSGLRMRLDGALGRGAVGDLVGGVPELRRLFNASIRGMWAYRPKPLPCRAVVLKAEADASRLESLRRSVAAVYPGGVRVEPVDGGHWSMLKEPYVGRLAETIRRSLRAADEEPGARSARTGVVAI